MSDYSPLITLVVLTKDEQDNIVRCLTSLLWCDEIILVDDSSDDTISLAKKAAGGKLRIIQTKSTDFAEIRNESLDKATHDWVLFIDADEEVSSNLASEIMDSIKNTNVDGFIFKRNDFFLGRWLKYGETAKVKLLKLGRKKAGGTWQRQVHETWNISGKIDELKNPILHYPHPTVGEFLSRISRWTELDAETFYRLGKRVSWWQIIAYPKAKFIRSYLFWQGFRDGMPGLIMALMMSFHSFLTRAKLYQLQKENSLSSRI